VIRDKNRVLEPVFRGPYTGGTGDAWAVLDKGCQTGVAKATEEEGWKKKNKEGGSAGAKTCLGATERG